jgi:hypothetical protein
MKNRPGKNKHLHALFALAIAAASCTRTHDTALHFEKNGAVYDFKRLADGAAAEKAHGFLKLTVGSFNRDHASPYPGTVSQNVVCDKSLAPKPAKFSNGEVEFDGYEIYADQRGTLNSCEAERAVQRAYWGFMKCEKTSAEYEIKVTYPKAVTSIQSELLSLHCL